MCPSSSAPRVPGSAFVGLGDILDIRFQSENFAIVRLALEDGQTVGALGNWDVVRWGGSYEIAGVWEDNGDWGPQLRIRQAQVRIPADASALAAYLSSAVEGIGAVTAERIASACPSDVPPEVWLRTKPDIDRVDPELISRAREAISKDGAIATAELELRKMLKGIPGFGRGRLRKILDKWGAKAPDMIREDPYCLRRVAGIGWRLSDRVAREAFGVEPSDPRRVRAGVETALEDLEKEGHTGTPEDIVIEEVSELLGFEPGILLGALNEFGLVYRPPTRAAEQSLAAGAVAWAQQLTPPISPSNPGFHVDALDMRDADDHPVPGFREMDLDEDQIDAVQVLLESSLGLLTGGPGTGKTTTIRALILVARFCGLSVCLGAPTGKAARRMIEQTGHPARTVHSLIGLGVKDDDDDDEPGGASQVREEWKRAELIVIDEASMLDVWMGAGIFEALAPGQRLIFVGDLAQLMPVGPGAVFPDLAASGKITRCHLGIVHRQENGRLLDLIHAIGFGELDIVSRLIAEDKPGGDLRILSSGDPDQIASWVQQLIRPGGKLEAAGYGEDDWQIVSPTNEVTELSVAKTNPRVQQALRDVPDLAECKARGWAHAQPCRFVVGDRVVVLKNEKLKSAAVLTISGAADPDDVQVVNGEQGKVLAIDYPAARLVVSFDGGVAFIPARSPRVALAYCVTVHKAQGSEWPVVILPLHSSQPQHMISQEWMYTAASRAARVLIIVGDPAMVAAAAGRPAPRRYGATVQRMNG